MGLLQTIFGAPAATEVAAGEGVAQAAVGVANSVADIVERWAPSDADKVKMQLDVQNAISAAVNQARQYDPRTQGTTKFSETVNVSVDAFSRLIRPTVTVLMVGGVFGWFNVQTKSIDPTVLNWGGLCIGYWF